MSLTNVAEVSELVQKFWAPMVNKELRSKNNLAGLVNKEFQGQIKQGGDTVYVSQINAPTGEIRDIGVDSDSFNSTTLSTTRVGVVANKRISASFNFEDLVDVQSQIGMEQSAIRESLMYSCEAKLNAYLKSLVSPSTSAPDHLLNSISDMNAAQMNAIRLLAAQAKWGKDKPWYGLVDPSYYTDIMNASTMVSGDYVSDKALENGNIITKRYGFNMIEDDSMGTDKGIFFHPDFMYLVMGEPRFKISDQHSAGKFAYVISCDMWVGATLGLQGSKKHIFATAAASGSDAS